MPDQEAYLSSLREARRFRPGDIETEAEFLALPDDMQDELDGLSESDGPSFSQAGVGRIGAARDMFARASVFDSAVQRYSARSERYGTIFPSEFPGSADYEPTPEDLLAVSERWGLDERHFEPLARRARSQEDLDVLAEAFASQIVRDQRVAASVGPVDGFLIDFAANALQPEFLALGGGAASVLKVGSALTRTGAAVRAGGAAAAADTPLELYRSSEDPRYSTGQALLTVLGSTALGAAAGSVGRLVSPEDITIMSDEIARLRSSEEALQAFSPSSVGAAQARAVATDAQPVVQRAEDVEQLKFSFGTPINFLHRSELGEVRELASRLTWNPWHNQAQSQTAFEAMRRINESGGTFLRQAEQAAQDWWSAGRGERQGLSEQAGRLTGGMTDRQRQEFGRRVGRHISGVEISDDPMVIRAASSLANGFEDSLRYVKDEFYNGPAAVRDGEWTSAGRGLADFADIEPDSSYLPRLPNAEGFTALQQRHLRGRDASFANRSIGQRLADVAWRSQENREWFESIAARRPDDPNYTGRWVASQVMTKYVETWERLSNQALREADSASPKLRQVSLSDRQAVREIVEEEFASADSLSDIPEAIDMVLDLIAPVRRSTPESSRAKHRMQLPFDAAQDADLLDMYEFDAFALFTQYRREMAGRAALLRVGFDSVSDAENAIARTSEATRGKDAKIRERNTREQRLLRDGLDAVLGRRPEHLMSAEGWQFWTGQIARSNVANMLSNVVFAQVSEIAGTVMLTQHRAFQRLPEYRRYLKAVREGDAQAMSEMFALSDAVMGLGSQQIRARMGRYGSRFDADFEEAVTPRSRFEAMQDERSRKVTNAAMRLSNATTEFLRTAIVTDDSWRFVQAARKGDRPYSRYQLRQLGIDDEMWDRISLQLRKMSDVESQDTGKLRPDLDLTRFDDPEALNVFVNALDRNARRLVQDSDWGHAPTELRNRPSLRLLFQFLSFPLNAWSKQLGHLSGSIFNRTDGAFANPRAVGETLAMSLGGAVGVMSRTALQAQTKSPEDRAEFIDRRLTGAEFLKGMIYYSAHASILPNVVDLGLFGASKFTDAEWATPIFSFTRNSGLPGDPLTGNPTRARAVRIGDAVSDLFDGTKFSEEDIRELVTATAPLGGFIGTQMLLSAGLKWLPDEQED